MAEKYLDSSLLDKAISFATKAHSNTERRGKGFPYIVHPLEALSIVATMTNDQKLLAAAVLHDVIEDTKVTIEEIEREFGAEIASIVKSETSHDFDKSGRMVSWREKKQETLDHLKNASKEAKMVALGDKLSNIRAMKNDYAVIGDKLWERFHDNNPKNHAWYYLSLVESLRELENYQAFKEFERDVHEVFDKFVEFKIYPAEREIVLEGYINKEDSFEIEKLLNKNAPNILNFEKVTGLSFGAMRTFVRLHQNGYVMNLRMVNDKVASKLEDSGIASLIPLTKKYGEGSIEGMYVSGEGFTSTTYFDEKDEDIMIKLFSKQIPIPLIEQEKVMAKQALIAGINTPISGEIIHICDRIGFTFERIVNKISFSRAIANEPEKIPEIARRFAIMAREFHQIKPIKGVFPRQADVVLESLSHLKFDEDIMNTLVSLVKEYADVETIIHGDFHTGNAVMTDKGDNIIIDLADLATGSPYYDLGSMYLFAHVVSDRRNNQIFHMDRATMKKFFDAFAPIYFEGKDLKKELLMCKKFASFRMVFNSKFHNYDVDMDKYQRIIRGLLNDEDVPLETTD